MTAAKEPLRAFLRSRRERVRPEAVGLEPGSGPRRVPGLRREEVAALAGVSVDYYTRFEQGRDLNVSEEVVRAVGRALQLEGDELAHLIALARPIARRRPRSASPPQRVRPDVGVLVDALGLPAFVLGRRLDVLATNRLARALLTDFTALPEAERNHARWVFLDPAARERYLDWEAVARDNVAQLRLQAGRHPEDERLTALIGELSVRSGQFAAWWADQAVSSSLHGRKRYHHPVVGELEVSFEALAIADAPDQRLYIYTAAPGSPSEQRLRLLADWTAAPLASDVRTTG